jgi:single-strand DNA-binding protein
MLIGNLTRDPEMATTSNGSKVCHFTVASNRNWVTDSGEKKEETEFSRVIAWQKLAELCGQLLFKGAKVYIEGRLRTSTWQGLDGTEKSGTEVVADDMILLTPKDTKPEEEEVTA